ncbi:uncharacterized protein LOC125178109 [Hyalella azteca]|uniref:Uncharacterized protein LOC125178109 n=1 Tax=Hyalella azteca TaxID=294128 RepID=A0A979FK85_HYAAZ|nr:uncharacterized protein LOC125178109 [Hyalella azteca]
MTEKCLVSEGCCGCSLRSGALATGIFYLVVNLLTLLYSILVMLASPHVACLKVMIPMEFEDEAGGGDDAWLGEISRLREEPCKEEIIWFDITSSIIGILLSLTLIFAVDTFVQWQA